MFSGLSNGVKVPEANHEIGGLMILNRTALVAYDPLQGDDVGVNLYEYPSNAFDANPTIKAPAFVNSVGGNPEPSHGYTWSSISEASISPFQGPLEFA